MNTVSLKSSKAQIYAALEAMREALDQERQAHRATTRDLEELRAKREAAIAKAKAKTAPVEAVKNPVTEGEATPMTIAEFCEAYCLAHGTKSVPSPVIKAWRASFKCRCPKCGGNGLYGSNDICYACQGTGEQTVSDVERNKNYWRFVASK